MQKGYKLLFYTIVYVFFINNVEGQIDKMKHMDKDFLSFEDSLFYMVEIEGCGTNHNFNLLVEKLPQRYLIDKLKSEDETVIAKALLLLFESKDESIVEEVTLILNYENEGLVRNAIRILVSTDSFLGLTFLQKALLSKKFKEKETYLTLLYALRDIPDTSSLSILNTFLEEESAALKYNSVKKLTKKNQVLLKKYFSGQKERVELLKSAVNNIEYFNWALRMISKDQNPLLFVDGLKKSKYKDSLEILQLREKIGDTGFSEKQKKILKSYHENKAELESLNH